MQTDENYWTKTPPTESGFYWFKETESDEPEVVEYESDMKWIGRCGSELGRTNQDWDGPPEGFYSAVKLTPPPPEK
jgi:hypothetical protein